MYVMNVVAVIIVFGLGNLLGHFHQLLCTHVCARVYCVLLVPVFVSFGSALHAKCKGR